MHEFKTKQMRTITKRRIKKLNSNDQRNRNIGINQKRVNRYGIRNSTNNFASMIRSWWWIYCCCYMCLLSHSGSNINVVNGAYSSDTDELFNELDRPSKYTLIHIFKCFTTLV